MTRKKTKSTIEAEMFSTPEYLAEKFRWSFLLIVIGPNTVQKSLRRFSEMFGVNQKNTTHTLYFDKDKIRKLK